MKTFDGNYLKIGKYKDMINWFIFTVYAQI